MIFLLSWRLLYFWTVVDYCWECGAGLYIIIYIVAQYPIYRISAPYTYVLTYSIVRLSYITNISLIQRFISLPCFRLICFPSSLFFFSIPSFSFNLNFRHIFFLFCFSFSLSLFVYSTVHLYFIGFFKFFFPSINPIFLSLKLSFSKLYVSSFQYH